MDMSPDSPAPDSVNDPSDDLDNAARTILNTLSNLGFPHSDFRSAFPAITNLHLGDRLAYLLHTDPDLHILIFDNGADTFVFGKGWEIVHYTGQTANLVGFDILHARKNHLQIITAHRDYF